MEKRTNCRPVIFLSGIVANFMTEKTVIFGVFMKDLFGGYSWAWQLLTLDKET